MSQHDDDRELHDRLRASDPAASLPPTDPERMARLLADTMSADPTTHGTQPQETDPRRRSPLPWLAAAAAATLIAGIGAVSLLGADDDGGAKADDNAATEPAPTGNASTQPAPTEIVLAAPAPSSGRCMVPTAELLSRSALAFEGTAQEIGRGEVVLVPTTFYSGDEADLVRVQSPPEAMAALVGAVEFEEGERYLVAATDGQVMVCGFSAPYSEELETLYAEAFGG